MSNARIALVVGLVVLAIGIVRVLTGHLGSGGIIAAIGLVAFLYGVATNNARPRA